MTPPNSTAEPAASHRTPSFYDDLGGTLAEAWRLLSRGVADRRSPLHTPAVATTGLDGSPQVRTVVLRGVDPSARTLRFHTDRRSGKFLELTANPRVAVLGYDNPHKIQLRIGGLAHLHHADEVAQAAWALSQARSRVCYTQPVAPGTAMEDASVTLEPLASGEENFVVVVVSIEAIEWLYLAHAGHRRARFRFEDEEWRANWLAP